MRIKRYYPQIQPPIYRKHRGQRNIKHTTKGVELREKKKRHNDALSKIQNMENYKKTTVSSTYKEKIEMNL